MLEIAQIYHVLNLELKKKTVRSLEYYGEGSRKLSILHARLRHQYSSLNSDLYRINITNDPKCQCGAPYEDSIHYLRDRPFNLKGGLWFLAHLTQRVM